MILLDTKIVSEVMRTPPAEAVVAWLNGQDSAKRYVSAISIGEIAYGLPILSDGIRRSGLRERFVVLAFDQRVLAYDESAARVYGELMVERKALGLPMSFPDGQVASIARHNHLTVVTRNVPDFEHCGIDIVNSFVSVL